MRIGEEAGLSWHSLGDTEENSEIHQSKLICVPNGAFNR